MRHGGGQTASRSQFFRLAQYFLRLLFSRHVAEDHYHAAQLAVVIKDRRGAVFNRDHVAVSVLQNRVVGQAHHASLFQHLGHRIIHRVARLLIEDGKHLVDRLSLRLAKADSSQLFRNGIDKDHSPVFVGGNHRVANAGQRNAEPLFALAHFRGMFLPLVHFMDDVKRQQTPAQ